MSVPYYLNYCGYIIFFQFIFNWKIIALHYCVHFCYTKHVSATGIDMPLALEPPPHSPPHSTPLGHHRVPQWACVFSKFPLAICFTYDNIYVSMLLSQFVPPFPSPVYNARDLGSIPGLGRFPGEGNGNPLQYSCLESPMDGGAWCRLLSMGSQRVGHKSTTSLPSPCMSKNLFSMSNLYFCLANKFISTIFLDSRYISIYIYALIYDFCFSDLLHSV